MHAGGTELEENMRELWIVRCTSKGYGQERYEGR